MIYLYDLSLYDLYDLHVYLYMRVILLDYRCKYVVSIKASPQV